MDAARRVPAVAYELTLTGASQQAESLPGVRLLVSHREYRSPSFGSWKKRYVSTPPLGFRHPVTLRPEPARIDCGAGTVVFAGAVLLLGGGVWLLPPPPV
jgi:hypothetical protein